MSVNSKLLKRLLTIRRYFIPIGLLIPSIFLTTTVSYYYLRYLIQWGHSTSSFITIIILLLVVFVFKRYIKSNFTYQINKGVIIELMVLLGLGLIFVSQGFLNYHGDEYDNILGGKLIMDGLLPYRDFFSHHMPLPYFLSGYISMFLGVSPLVFRAVYLSIIFLWVGLIYYKARNTLSRNLRITLIFLISISAAAIWSNMIFAETLVGLSALHMFFIISEITKQDSFKLTNIQLVEIALVGSIPVLSSIGFVLLTIFFYLCVFFLILRKDNKTLRSRIKQSIKLGAVILLPFSLFLFQLLITRSFDEFIFQNVTFNKEYYSIFLIDVPSSPPMMLLNYVINLLNTVSFDITEFLKNPLLIYPFILEIFVYSAILISFLLRKYFLSIFLLITFILLNSRQGNILDVDKFHDIQSILFSFLSICLLIELTKNLSTNIGKFLFTTNLILLILFLGWLFNYNKDVLVEFRKNPKPGIVTEETDLNELINNDDNIKTVWLGPGYHDQMIFLEKPLATKYYYWYPWHSVCEECKEELISDLEKNKPDLIYWENIGSIWGINTKDFGKDIDNFLAEKYVLKDKNTYYLKE